MKFGYMRVSTLDQNLDRQKKQLEEFECDRIFFEKVTGTKRNRPELNSMLEFLRPEDTVVVTDLTRLSRSTKISLKLRNEFLKRSTLEKSKGIMARYNNSTWENVVYYFRWYCSI